MELFKIRTNQFEGPLELLLFLIQKNELDISAISLHQITDQYLQTIEYMQELNLDLASEFLIMAATLIHLKSKRLLPEDDTTSHDSPDAKFQTEDDLVQRLLNYKKFQEAGRQFLDFPQLGRDTFVRPGIQPPEKHTIWKELDLTSLTLAFQDVLKRSRRRTHIVTREALSLPEKIKQLAQTLKVGEPTEFLVILSEATSRAEIIVTFMVILELCRLRKLKVYQNKLFGSIYLTLTETLSELDPMLLTGFQYNAKKIEELVAHE